MRRQRSVRRMVMRGGMSKEVHFLAEDLPSDIAARDRILLSILGSPDPRQVDGIGCAMTCGEAYQRIFPMILDELK